MKAPGHGPSSAVGARVTIEMGGSVPISIGAATIGGNPTGGVAVGARVSIEIGGRVSKSMGAVAIGGSVTISTGVRVTIVAGARVSAGDSVMGARVTGGSVVGMQSSRFQQFSTSAVQPCCSSQQWETSGKRLTAICVSVSSPWHRSRETQFTTPGHL